MIAVLSGKIADSIRKHDPNAASKEVLMYGITNFLHTSLTFILIFGICTVSGRLIEALISTISFIILRFFSGGVHLHSSWKCDIISTLAITGLAHIAYPFQYAGWLVNAAALLLVAILAPKKPNLTYRMVVNHKSKLKWISMGIVALNFAIQSPAAANAFLLQSLSLTKPFYSLFSLIDRR